VAGPHRWHNPQISFFSRLLSRMIMSLKKSKASAGSGTPLAPKLNRVPLPAIDPEDDVILLTRSKIPPPSTKATKPVPLKSCLKKRDSLSSSTSSISSLSSRSPPPRYTSKEDITVMSEAETSPKRPRAFRSRDLRVGSGCVGSDYEMDPKTPKSILKKASALSQDPITLHWQLLPYNCQISRKFLRFDISHSPKTSIRDLNTGRLLAESDYLKLASQPALDEMLIRCEHGAKMEPWNIYVHRKGGIRCIDVFQAIHTSFSTPLEDDERKKIPRTRLSSCDKAFKRRCESSANLTLWEERQGMRRVDLLEGRTIFLGLALAPSRDCWLLQLGFPSL